MTMMESPRSAHEINRRVRRIEMDHAPLEVTSWNLWESNGASWGREAMVRESAQTNAVPKATSSQADEREPRSWVVDLFLAVLLGLAED